MVILIVDVQSLSLAQVTVFGGASLINVNGWMAQGVAKGRAIELPHAND